MRTKAWLVPCGHRLWTLAFFVKINQWNPVLSYFFSMAHTFYAGWLLWWLGHLQTPSSIQAVLLLPDFRKSFLLCFVYSRHFGAISKFRKFCNPVWQNNKRLNCRYSRFSISHQCLQMSWLRIMRAFHCQHSFFPSS